MRFRARALVLLASLAGFFLTLVFALVIQLVTDHLGIKNPLYVTLPITGIAFVQLIGISYVIYFYERVFTSAVAQKLNLERENHLIFSESGSIVIDATERVMMVTGIWDKRFGQNIVSKRIDTISPVFHQAMNSPNTNFELSYKGYSIEIMYTPVNRTIMVRDVSRASALSNYIQESRTIIGMLHVNNLDSILRTTSGSTPASLNSDINKRLYDWAEKYNILLRSLTPDSFHMILQYKDLQRLIASNFDIIGKIQEVGTSAGLQTGITIGLAHGLTSFSNLNEIANDSLKLGINRGGNQAVVKEYGQPALFYGATVETASTAYGDEVKFFTTEFVNIVKRSKRLYVMGHKFGDFDTVGAALGIATISKWLNVPISIVIENARLEEKARKSLRLLPNHIRRLFISPQRAIKELSGEREGSTVVVVDASDRTWVEVPELIDLTESIVIIDHHRVKEQAINGQLRLVDPSASSTVEIVTQMIMSASDDIKLSEIEANIMMAGIVTDSNSFRVRTNAKTYAAAMKLREFGSNPSFTWELLKDTFDDFIMKSKIYSTAFEIQPNVMVVTAPEDFSTTPAFIAQIADGIISNKNVKAVFVISKIGSNMIGLSARSNGQFNVMLVCEELGGGGHFSAAGAQFKEITIVEVLEMLKAVLLKNKGD